MVKKNQNNETVKVVVKVKRVYFLEEKRRYLFDAVVNGVFVEGLALQEYTNKEGKDGSMICYPSRKGKDKDGKEKYFNTVWFPVSKELKDSIEVQIGELLEKGNN